MTAQEYIKHLQLQPHPEGGYFKETYRSTGIINKDCLSAAFAGNRHFSTAIYYLLEKGDYSGFHRIKSDECWHFYGGDTLLLHLLDEGSGYSCIKLGNKLQDGEQFQFVVPANVWFASEPQAGSLYSLVGCTVAPGFDFADFEMANRERLLERFPEYKEVIERLCR